jgi:N-acetylneuraminic acid mutarotase
VNSFNGPSLNPGNCYGSPNETFCYGGSVPNPCFNSVVGVAEPDGKLCSLGLCAGSTGICHHGLCEGATQLPNGASCDNDGDRCNGVPTCDGWQCQGGTPISVSDNNFCTEDLCDPATGLVAHLPFSSDFSCDDGRVCDGTQEFCDGNGGCKARVPPPSVDDNNPCTVDQCTEPSGVARHVKVPDGTSCSDGNACNGLDLCKTGVCKPGTAIIIPDDGNPCTIKKCDPVLGIVVTPAPAGSSCSNGNACDGAETCDGAGRCQAGAPLAIDDHNVCTVDACDPATGATHVVSWPDDGNPCTTAIACDPVMGSTQAPSAAGASCSDGNACNGVETCDGHGACLPGIALTVDDHNPCTIDSCNPASGAAHSFVIGGASCADGNLCNGQELCDGRGVCVAGSPPLMSDGQDCTVDSCDPALGVQHIWRTDANCSGQRPTWLNLAGSAPSPRDSAAGAFADVTGELVVVSGNNGGAMLADTWLFDTKTGLWRQSYARGPSARAGAAVTYDGARKRILMFGGVSDSSATAQYLSDVWEYDPVTDAWTQRGPSGSGPAPRAYAALTFDSVHGQALLFGGVGTTNYGDTWQLNSASGSWTLVSSIGPAARAGAVMGFDPVTGHATLFGGAPHTGAEPGIPFGDTWELDPTQGTWTAVTPQLGEGAIPGSSATFLATPAPRTAHSLTFDGAAHVFKMFGGTGIDRSSLSDFWQYSPNSKQWTPLVFGPPGRAGGILAYSPARQGTFLSTGLSYSTSGLFTPQFSDVWEYGTQSGSWADRVGRGAPIGLYRGFSYDSKRAVLVAVGKAPAMRRDLVWEYDDQLQRWRSSDAIFTEGRVAPSFSSGPAMYDSARGVAIDVSFNSVFPQVTQSVSISEWNGRTWRNDCQLADQLYGMSVVFDPVRSKLVMPFGYNAGSYWSPFPSTLLELDPVTCAKELIQTDGRQLWPYGRTNAAGVWDSRRDRGIFFGGSANGQLLNDTWALTTSTHRWQLLGNVGTPPPPSGTSVESPALAYDPAHDKLVLLQPTQQTWELDLASDRWSQTGGGGPVPPNSLTFDGRAGNVTALDANGDLWDWSGSAWTKRVTNAAPSARSGMASAYSAADNYTVAFGGMSGDGRRSMLGDTWIFRDGWKLVSSTTANQAPTNYIAGLGFAPSPRTGHALTAGFQTFRGGSRGLLFGGETESAIVGDTWIWFADLLTWARAATTSSPPARTGAALAAFPDMGVLLFGGKAADGSYDPQTYEFQFTSNNGGDWIGPSGDIRSPGGRWAHAMALDPVRKRIILFGGKNDSGALGDTWQFDPTVPGYWTKRTPLLSPPARFGHQLTWDVARSRLVLTGGAGSADSPIEDTWEWDDAGNTWRVRDPERKLPARVGHAAFYDGAGKQIVVFGGLLYQAHGSSTFAYGDTVAFERAGASGDGAATFPQGAGCTSSSDCTTGQCVDGFCCDSACDEQCGSCGLPGKEGTCSPVTGPPKGGRAACASADECSQCGGFALTGCGVADATACGANGCLAGSILHAGTCTGGVCSGGAISCAPFNCNDSGCRYNCSKDSDCFSGYFCLTNRGSCLLRAKISDISVSPQPGVVGKDVFISATAPDDPQGGPPMFRFSYGFGDTPVYPCGNGFGSPYCDWVPDTPGEYAWHVEVRAYQSTTPDLADDERDINVTVVSAP